MDRKLPKSVNILGMKFKVTHKLPEKYKDDKTMYKTTSGFILPMEKLIWINPKFPMEEQWRTLIHEMGHGTMIRNGIRFSNFISEDLEEVIVETFSSTFYEMFIPMIEKLDG